MTTDPTLLDELQEAEAMLSITRTAEGRKEYEDRRKVILDRLAARRAAGGKP